MCSLVPWTTNNAHVFTDSNTPVLQGTSDEDTSLHSGQVLNGSTLLILPLYATCCMCVGPLLVVGGLSLPTGSLTLPLLSVSLPPSSPLPGSTLLRTRYFSPAIFFRSILDICRKARTQ